MATNTENLGLKKDLSTDFYDIETFNANFDKIDEFAGRKDNPHGVTKAQVGLDKVDNTTDADKPVSTAQATAISDAKAAGTSAQANLTVHINNKSNPHGVTKSQVGLGNVDNTSDANKPVSTAQQTALNTKVDKVSGKGLSTNDYTTTEKTKLSGIEAGANKYVLPSASSTLGGVKSGGDVTISGGVITVNDNSHAHSMANISGLDAALSNMEAEYGTYEGNGQYGNNSPTIINFSRIPKAVFIAEINDRKGSETAPVCLPYGITLCFYYSQLKKEAVQLQCEWGDDYLSFKSGLGAAYQFNAGNGTYAYIFIY